jgi:hypothetical protein
MDYIPPSCRLVTGTTATTANTHAMTYNSTARSIAFRADTNACSFMVRACACACGGVGKGCGCGVIRALHWREARPLEVDQNPAEAAQSRHLKHRLLKVCWLSHVTSPKMANPFTVIGIHVITHQSKQCSGQRMECLSVCM